MSADVTWPCQLDLHGVLPLAVKILIMRVWLATCALIRHDCHCIYVASRANFDYLTYPGQFGEHGKQIAEEQLRGFASLGIAARKMLGIPDGT